MFLKDFKSLLNQSDLVTVHNSPVTYKIDNEKITLCWTGLDTGHRFIAFLDPEGMINTEIVDDNTVGVNLYTCSKSGIIHCFPRATHFSFWHKIGIPVVKSLGLKGLKSFGLKGLRPLGLTTCMGDSGGNSGNGQGIKEKRSKKRIDNETAKN